MGAVAAVVVAVASVGASLYSAKQQKKEAKRAQRAAEKSAAEQRKAQQEARAGEAARSAQERRQQLREERVRRSMIIQQSENTGVGDSSGSIGATGALSTNLASNLGFNRGEVHRGQRIGGYMDSAADYSMESNRHMNRASMWGSIGSFSQSIFHSVGGLNTLGIGAKKE